MSESNPESTQKPSKRLPKEPRASRFPKIMVVVTALVVAAIILIHRVFLFEVQEMTGLGKDILNLVTYLLILLTFIFWVITLAFLNRWKMKSRVIGLLALFSVPAMFFALGPVFGGDVGFLRFEPFWMAKPKPADVESVGQIDLATETPFDFPRFLGPEQDGHAAIGISLNPEKFKDAKRVWTLPIGEGWSGFTARNGYAITMEQRDELECVTCYEIATGKLAWIYQHEARHQDFADLGHVGPRSTPTIHDGKVYAMGAVGNLVCLNGNDGTVVWQKDLNPILGIELAEGNRSGHAIQWEENTSLAWGRSGSPLIVDDLVVVPGGGPKNDASTLLAFNRSTGELVWQGGTEMIAYGSPILATVSAQQQILIVAESKVMGFDPKSGDVLWSHPRPGASDAMANCSQPTIVSDSYILTSKGYPDGGGELIALNIDKDGLKPESIWSNSRVLKTKFTNPVIFDGHAYSISSGLLECTNLARGERVWKHRKRLANGQILKVGNYILTHSESGGNGPSEIHLIEPSPSGYKELGSFRTVKGTCWNNLCVYENFLLIRSEREAACFELPANSSAF